MIDPKAVCHAIMMVESNGQHNALGDEGRALGPFQFHPEAFWDWMLRPEPGCTWADWFYRAALRFVVSMYNRYPDIEAREIAVVFHQHCYVRRATEHDFIADDYATRFDAQFIGATHSGAAIK